MDNFDKDKIWKCSICHKEYELPGQLQKHKNTVHGLIYLNDNIQEQHSLPSPNQDTGNSERNSPEIENADNHDLREFRIPQCIALSAEELGNSLQKYHSPPPPYPRDLERISLVNESIEDHDLGELIRSQSSVHNLEELQDFMQEYCPLLSSANETANSEMISPVNENESDINLNLQHWPTCHDVAHDLNEICDVIQRDHSAPLSNQHVVELASKSMHNENISMLNYELVLQNMVCDSSELVDSIKEDIPNPPPYHDSVSSERKSNVNRNETVKSYDTGVLRKRPCTDYDFIELQEDIQKDIPPPPPYPDAVNLEMTYKNKGNKTLINQELLNCQNTSDDITELYDNIKKSCFDLSLDPGYTNSETESKSAVNEDENIEVHDLEDVVRYQNIAPDLTQSSDNSQKDRPPPPPYHVALNSNKKLKKNGDEFLKNIFEELADFLRYIDAPDDIAELHDNTQKSRCDLSNYDDDNFESESKSAINENKDIINLDQGDLGGPHNMTLDLTELYDNSQKEHLTSPPYRVALNSSMKLKKNGNEILRNEELASLRRYQNTVDGIQESCSDFSPNYDVANSKSESKFVVNENENILSIGLEDSESLQNIIPDLIEMDHNSREDHPPPPPYHVGLNSNRKRKKTGDETLKNIFVELEDLLKYHDTAGDIDELHDNIKKSRCDLLPCYDADNMESESKTVVNDNKDIKNLNQGELGSLENMTYDISELYDNSLNDRPPPPPYDVAVKLDRKLKKNGGEDLKEQADLLMYRNTTNDIAELQDNTQKNLSVVYHDHDYTNSKSPPRPHLVFLNSNNKRKENGDETLKNIFADLMTDQNTADGIAELHDNNQKDNFPQPPNHDKSGT